MPNKLEEKDWERLLQKIKDRKCTPFLGSGASFLGSGASFLGSGACSEMMPFNQIVSELAKKYDYPMEDSYDLARVAQYVAVTEEDEMVPRDEICKKITELSEEITPKFFDTPAEIHGILADLQLPVYITTNYDDLMERALKSRGKTPITKICLWNEELKQLKPIPSNYFPTHEKPLVFHIHGIYGIPKSLVLTEYDYLDFFAAISKKPNLLPPCIREAFANSSLLFLGYRIADWDFHVLFRILAEFLKRYQRKHYSVQLVPGGDVPETQKEKAHKYLDQYFDKLDINVYWQDCREFAAELRTRWEAFNHGPIQTDTNSMNRIARNLEPVKTILSSPNIYQTKPEYEQLGQIKNETSKVSILFLASDPTDASRLRLGEEFREIHEKLKLAKLRDLFRLELPQLSVRPSDITQALLDTIPQIVHFSGHGTPTGALCFENLVGEIHPIKPDALTSLFEQFSGQVNCVILNACYSEIQAKAISKHVKYVIGMNQAIGDKAAIDFAIGFYQALGGGRSIEDAYKLGRVQIQLQNIPEHLTPVLIKKVQS